MKQQILIAGGGITGLSTAYSLQKLARKTGASVEIMVVEARERLGGKVKTERVDGMIIEHGPESFLATKPWMRQLCEELGLELVGLDPAARQTFIYHEHGLSPIPAGMNLMIPTQLWPFVKTPLLSVRGKLRAALEPLIPVGDGQEDESIGSFVSRRFGREVCERIAGPLMAGIHGGDWRQVSMKATFPSFVKMEREKGSLLLAARRAAGSPGGRSGFLTVREGLSSVVSALALATDAEFRLSARLRSIRPVGEGRGYDVLLDDGDLVSADSVVLTLPGTWTASLLNPLLPEAAAELRAIPYGASVVVMLGYDRSDIDHPLDGAGVIVPRPLAHDLSAITFVSSKWPHTAPRGKALVRCVLSRAGRQDWANASDALILSAVRSGLRQILGIRAEPSFVRVIRWTEAMPEYRVGHLDRVGRIEQQVGRMPGLFLAGAPYRGIGLPDCVREGEQAAERVAEHLGWTAVARPQ